MAVTVQQIFDIAIHLMDSQNESTGSTDTADTKEYKLRTVSLLNSVLDRAFPYSDNYREALEAAGGKRPICPKVTEMADEVALDERICTGRCPTVWQVCCCWRRTPAEPTSCGRRFWNSWSCAARTCPA